LRPSMVIPNGRSPSWSPYGGGGINGGPGGGVSGGPGGRATSPSRARIKALLAGKITPHGKAARIGELLKHGGYPVSFKAPTAGRVVIQWYFLPTRGDLRNQVLVATVTKTFRTAKTARILVRLTDNGTRLLNGDVQVTLIAKGSFFPHAQPVVKAFKGPFTIRR
jgi:hypothetical protein